MIAIMVFLLAGVIVNAQTDKGNWLLAGASNLSHAFGSSKTKYDGTTETNYRYMELNLQPAAGYFFIDNLVGGLFIDWDYDFYKDPDDDDKYCMATIIAGPFVRYYFLQDAFRPFVHAQAGLGGYREKSSYAGGSQEVYKEFVFAHKIGAGVDYFLNDNVAVGAMIGFSHEAYREKVDDNGGERAESYKYIYDEFFLQIGVTVILGNN